MIFQDFLQLYNECQPIQKPVKTINIKNTIVVTYTHELNNAINYFATVQKEIPDFILIDWNGIKNINITTAPINKFNVYPYTKIKTINYTNFCLYCNPSIEFNEEYSSIFLLLECYQKGIEDHFIFLENYYNRINQYSIVYEKYINLRLLHAFIIYKKLADELSKKTYLQVLKAHATGNVEYLLLSPYTQYIHPKVQPTPEDTIIVDGGSLDANTAILFSNKTQNNAQILSFEAVPSLYENCIVNAQNYPNIKMVPYALWDKDDTFFITNNQGGSFITKDKTENSETCYSLALDKYYQENNIQDCSLIKLDIERAEPNALEGAKNTIQKYKPKLQVSIYHAIDQFFDIPLTLMTTYPDYEFYLGHHTICFWETILYARKK